MIDMSLIENAAKSAYRDFAVFGDDGCVGDFAGSADELDVTAFLTEFCEASCFEAALHFAKG